MITASPEKLTPLQRRRLRENFKVDESKVGWYSKSKNLFDGDGDELIEQNKVLAAHREQERKQEIALAQREEYIANRAIEYESERLDKARNDLEAQRRRCMSTAQVVALERTLLEAECDEDEAWADHYEAQALYTEESTRLLSKSTCTDPGRRAKLYAETLATRRIAEEATLAANEAREQTKGIPKIRDVVPEAEPEEKPRELLLPQTAADRPLNPNECDALTRAPVPGGERYLHELSIPQRYAINRSDFGRD